MMRGLRFAFCVLLFREHEMQSKDAESSQRSIVIGGIGTP